MNPRVSVAALGMAVGVAVSVLGCAAPEPRVSLSPEQQLLFSYEDAMRSGQPAKARDAATRLLVTEREPWVQVLVARAWLAEGNRDKAFDELSAAIGAIAGNPICAGPLAIDLAESLEGGDEGWAPLRSDPRFPALLARAKSATWTPPPLAFDASPSGQPARTPRPDVGAEELRALREKYSLDEVVAGATDDLDRVQRMCRWVHNRTSHEGWGVDEPADALALLRAADKGAQWRCVEYGIVMAGCLNAVGIPARAVGGRARDVETLMVGAGHVFAEAWLEDRSRWVFIDAQMDVVAIDADGTPMSSPEFRNSLARPSPPIPYSRGLALCLHYFTFPARLPDGKDVSVMLGPVGSTMPTRFQRQPADAPALFTHRLADVYSASGR